MDGIKKFTPRVSKRILLFIAGLVWGFAGFRVFTLGFGDVMSHHGNLIITIIFAAVIFFVFFKFIFSKMFKKHTTRIVNSKLDKHCVFYPVYLGDFYMGLGAALFMAGVYFFVGFFTFDNLKVKYKIS